MTADTFSVFKALDNVKKKHICILGLISSTFYSRFFCRYLFAQKSQSQTVIREKLRNLLSYEKGASKMLMKLTLDHFTKVIIFLG